MAITNSEKERLNQSMPIADDIKLGNIIQGLQNASGGAGGSVAWADVTGKPTTFAPAAHAHAYADITGKPATFAPSAHTHLWADITDKPATFAPATHAHAWADITGKPTTFAPATHTHTIADVTNLQTTLDGKLTATKSATQANSTAADVAGLVADFNALLAKLKAAGLMA